MASINNQCKNFFNSLFPQRGQPVRGRTHAIVVVALSAIAFSNPFSAAATGFVYATSALIWNQSFGQRNMALVNGGDIGIVGEEPPIRRQRLSLNNERRIFAEPNFDQEIFDHALAASRQSFANQNKDQSEREMRERKIPEAGNRDRYEHKELEQKVQSEDDLDVFDRLAEQNLQRIFPDNIEDPIMLERIPRDLLIQLRGNHFDIRTLVKTILREGFKHPTERTDLSDEEVTAICASLGVMVDDFRGLWPAADLLMRQVHNRSIARQVDEELNRSPDFVAARNTQPPTQASQDECLRLIQEATDHGEELKRSKAQELRTEALYDLINRGNNPDMLNRFLEE
jgi:hypothetical protein